MLEPDQPVVGDDGVQRECRQQAERHGGHDVHSIAPFVSCQPHHRSGPASRLAAGAPGGGAALRWLRRAAAGYGQGRSTARTGLASQSISLSGSAISS